MGRVRVLETLPVADSDVRCIVHQHIDPAVDSFGYGDRVADALLAGGDVELQNGRPRCLKRLKLLQLAASGDDLVPSCEDAMDELLAEPGGAAANEPDKLRHFEDM